VNQSVPSGITEHYRSSKHYRSATNRNSPRVIERQLRDPVFIFPFPVNLWPTQTYDSTVGGNVSSGLGNRGHHGLRGVRSMEADDRPTEWNKDRPTNRKSPLPATKTPLQQYQCIAEAIPIL